MFMLQFINLLSAAPRKKKWRVKREGEGDRDRERQRETDRGAEGVDGSALFCAFGAGPDGMPLPGRRSEEKRTSGR